MTKSRPILKTTKKPKGAFFGFKDGYQRPRLNFDTSTTIWRIDETITKKVQNWKAWTGEDGRSGSRAGAMREEETAYSGTYSVFPAPLAEYIILRYGGEPGNKIIDPFAGGPVRGVVSSVMGYEYHGVDVRQGAIDEDLESLERLDLSANYHLGDSRHLHKLFDRDEFDFCFSCPPYFNLEVYSDQEDDISNIDDYWDFHDMIAKVFKSLYKAMKTDAFVCMVVGNFRVKGKLVDFRGDTVANMEQAGFEFWQDVVLSRSAGSAAIRAGTSWKGLKLVPRHEYLLVFRK